MGQPRPSGVGMRSARPLGNHAHGYHHGQSHQPFIPTPGPMGHNDQADPNGTVRCMEPVRRAITIEQYIALINAAERLLIRAGFRSLEDRIHILTGIYYGTTWSRDFAEEHSEVRNAAFQIYTGRVPWSTNAYPRSHLGCGLYLSLWQSQDVEGIDMGHVLIGLDARTRYLSREINIPHHGASGLQVVTWVGDLGGAAARLALDRVREPRTPVSRYFRGTDYGSSSNLEGDIAAYVVANTGSSSVSSPSDPSDSVAAAMLHYFRGRSYRGHYRRFLEMQGATFAGDTLTNRSAVEQAIANRFESFGGLYLSNFISQHPNRYNDQQIELARRGLGSSSRDVAHHFVDWLLKSMSRSMRNTPSRHRDSH